MARQTRGEDSRFFRVGTFAYRRRWWVIGAWVLAVALLAPQLGELTGRMSSGGFEAPGSQSDRVKKIIESDFKGQYNQTDLLVMTSDSLAANDPGFRAVFADVKAALEAAPGVAEVLDPYSNPELSISADGSTLTARVGLNDDQDQALEHSPALEAALEEASAGTQVRSLLTGAAPFYHSFQETTTHDLERAERIALPITLVILALAFGTLLAAGMPLIMALVALAASFGLISILADKTTVSIFTQNMASMIGLGVGIDYSLFVLTRYRERLRAGGAIEEAIAESMATSGKAVFVSAITVIVSLAGTLLIDLAAFRSMGIGAMIAVAVAAAAALTLLPALLGVVGHRIESFRLRPRRETRLSGMWHRWATTVMRRPWPALILAVVIVGALAAPALDLNVGSSGVAILPKESKVRQAAEITADAFGEGQVAPVQIVIRHGEDVLGQGFADVYEAVDTIARHEEVVRVDSIASFAPGAPLETARAAATSPETAPFVQSMVAGDGKTTLISAVARHGSQSDESDELVRDLRADLPQIAPDAEILVGGDPGLNEDINEELSGKLPYVVALVLVLSFFILLLFLRSLLLPLKAVILNLCSVLAAYGLLVTVFQKGFGEGLLGFEAQGNIDPFLPVFLFCILFGLSMDYEVFMLSRIREEYLKTRDNTEAVGWGLEHTAGIITSAAAIMVTVFGGFAAASLIPIKATGFGLAVAVFLDATLIRAVLVPASMRLMGDWNWWLPGWLDRLLPKISLEEAPETPDPSEGQPEPATA
ncbi:MAG: MMPL family transporter [Actinobacteria bacterium]|nr:MMPL family transporter [Actinomycetota bacterium]